MRVPREHRYSKHGKGGGEIVTIVRVVYFIAPLHLVVICVVYSLIDSSISFFGEYVSNSCVCNLLLKCVYCIAYVCRGRYSSCYMIV